MKAKVLSDKQDERDLNTCDRDVREELSTSTKAGEKKSQSNASDDSGGDDSDNWESFYDESGGLSESRTTGRGLLINT